MPPLYQAFAPDVLLVQLGADSYFGDPLAHLLLSTRGLRDGGGRLRALTGGRLVAVGGGYDVEATPRIWALELVTLAGLDLPPRFATALAAWRDPPGTGPDASGGTASHAGRGGGGRGHGEAPRLPRPRSGRRHQSS